MLSKAEKDFLLIPKALPSSTHTQNLRKVFSATEWKKLRDKVCQVAENKCELCGAERKLELHELWVFDFVSQTQSLQRLVALCMHCHRFQHALFLKLQTDRGLAHDFATVKHFNNLSGKNLTSDQFYALATQFAKKLEDTEWEVVFNLKEL